MAASDAVRSTAIARREVRNSLERMEFHLARGVKGTRGVSREVKFLDALHRQNAIQGARAVGQSVAINPRRSFGQEALSALKSGDGRTISAAKSSVLADFSADGLAAPRSISERFPQWKWQANGSACPTCLSKHGNIYTGVFIPTHPSCLCIAASPASDIRPLTEGELIDMNAKYGDPRYSKLMEDLKAGRKTMADVRAVENVNAGRKGFLAVRQHNLQGIVRQNRLGTGTRAPRPSAPEGGFGPAASAPEVAEVAEVAETFEPLTVYGDNAIIGKPTKAMRSAMAEAEQIMADAVGASRGFVERGIGRIHEFKMTASKGKRRVQKTNGTWHEKGLKRNRGKLEKIDRRLTMEMNRSDFTAHNAWVDAHDAYASRITARQIIDTPAVRSSSTVRGKAPTFKPNPEWLPNADNERWNAMQKWIKANPEPSAKFAATSQQLAETLLHEIVHAADYGTGIEFGFSQIDRTVLRAKLKKDGIDKLAAQAYADGDASMWYAASRGKPGETIADLTRMYFFGDRYDTTGVVLKTAAEWRAKYPQMALWVEDNVLTL